MLFLDKGEFTTHKSIIGLIQWEVRLIFTKGWKVEMNWNAILRQGFKLPHGQIRAPDEEKICCWGSLLEVLASISSYHFNISSDRRKYLSSFATLSHWFLEGRWLQ